MLFSYGKIARDVTIYLNGSQIEQVETCKFLGVVIDSKLSWKQHCQKVQISLSRNLGIIRKLKYELPADILFSIYKTLFMPHLQYGILAWGNTYPSYINQLHIIQKKTLRIINNSRFAEHSSPLFRKYRTLTVFDLYKYHLGVLMYKFETNNLPKTIYSLFNRNSDIHSYDTRSAVNLHLHKVRTSLYLSTVRNQGPLLWNKLKPMPAFKSLVHFKKYLKTLFLLNYQTDC